MNEKSKLNTSQYFNKRFLQDHNNPNILEIKNLGENPNCFEAEKGVLGALLVDSSDDSIEKVSTKLDVSDFYKPNHQEIFKACTEIFRLNQKIDYLTVSNYLKNKGILEEVGGMPYLIDLGKFVPSAASIETYANIVHDFSLRRQLVKNLSEIMNQAKGGEGTDVHDILDNAQQCIAEIVAQNIDDNVGPQPLNSILDNALARIRNNINNPSGITGLSTGFTALDHMTTGFQQGDLIILAARPSMGKTTFAMNLVTSAVMKAEKPVVVFSLEMPSWQLGIRLICSIAKVEMDHLNKGKLNSEEMNSISKAISLLNDRKNHLFVDDQGGLSPNDVRERVRKIYKEFGGISLIMIDYLQLMRVPSIENNKQLEVSEISSALKRMAKEFKVPVIALSQLNRTLEQRTDKRPMNSDLRESGAIEQDADLIMFIYRDEVYHPDTKDKNIAEIIIGKQRNGPIGKVELFFQGQYSLFSNISKTDYDDQGFVSNS